MHAPEKLHFGTQKIAQVLSDKIYFVFNIKWAEFK